MFYDIALVYHSLTPLPFNLNGHVTTRHTREGGIHPLDNQLKIPDYLLCSR